MVLKFSYQNRPLKVLVAPVMWDPVKVFAHGWCVVFTKSITVYTPWLSVITYISFIEVNRIKTKSELSSDNPCFEDRELRIHLLYICCRQCRIHNKIPDMTHASLPAVVISARRVTQANNGLKAVIIDSDFFHCLFIT